MGTTKKIPPEFEARYKKAIRLGSEHRKADPYAASVRFDAEACSYVVRLTDGKGFEIPASDIPELAKATPAQLADVGLFGEGEGLYWDALDAAISTGTLIDRAFGDTVRRIAASKAASITSEARAAAARANGAKGGRPRKVKAQEFASAEPNR